MSQTHFLTIEDANILSRSVGRRLRWQLASEAARTLAIALTVAVTVFLVASGPAQLVRLTYWWNHWLGIEHTASSATLSPSQFLGHNPETVTAPSVTKSHVVIPAIHVDAPILWEQPLADASNGLQRGVVEAQESILPGKTGRTFIVGHSSGYWWNHNPWTKVFALLDQLHENDLIFLERDGVVYAYRMTGSEVVSPSEVRVVRDDSLRDNQLALMTCTPVGTSLNRLVVYATPVPLAD